MDDELVFVLGKRDANQQSHLDFAWTPFRPPTATGAERGKETTARLMENVTTIEFAYFGTPDARRPAQWWDSWDGTKGLPTLVRLRLSFPQGDRRRWPDLIVRLVRRSSSRKVLSRLLTRTEVPAGAGQMST